MARITHGDIGDTWTPQATFTVGGTPTDPTNITVKIRDAAGTITTLGPVSGASGGSGIVRVSAGKYNTVIAITAAGYWTANFTGTGTAAASEDHEYRADPSGFTSNWGLDTRALVSVPETKDWLQSQNIDTDEDLDLVRVINDISSRFHDEAAREFKVSGTNPQARTFEVDYPAARCAAISVGDLTSATTVEILDIDWTTVLATVTSTDYSLMPLVRESWEPVRRIKFSRNVRYLRAGLRVRVTGNFGFPLVPGNVRQAVLEAVSAALDRDVENYRQDLSPRADSGGGTILQVTQAPMFLSLPPSVIAVARSYASPLVG